MCRPEERREMAQFVAQCCGGVSTTHVEEVFSEVRNTLERDGFLDLSITEDRLMEEFCATAALRSGLPQDKRGIRALALRIERSLAQMSKFTPRIDVDLPVALTFRPQTG